jgi:hypothetical protein
MQILIVEKLKKDVQHAIQTNLNNEVTDNLVHAVGTCN